MKMIRLFFKLCCPLSVPTDCVDTCVQGDISADAADYEAESWSLTVEHKFCKRHDKRAVKRQDVIYGKQSCERRPLECFLFGQCPYFIYKIDGTAYIIALRLR